MTSTALCDYDHIANRSVFEFRSNPRLICKIDQSPALLAASKMAKKSPEANPRTDAGCQLSHPRGAKPREKCELVNLPLDKPALLGIVTESGLKRIDFTRKRHSPRPGSECDLNHRGCVILIREPRAAAYFCFGCFTKLD